ncbi:MAG: phage tail protein [Solobacterium sp.]|jgi:hypothetical protein|nr:phage tail protein [Solobacterium sp.]MCH4047988.1 phage tail protein [Solobacterium sp.]MCH4075426.1 phage tail protein [Solobacterium sp.]MCI1313724.1 phage tail protein [Solobacterium sp.]MCI1407121.1 phage tail protein [Solobacterium sp.]
MGNTVSNVTTGKPKKTGAIFSAPLGSTLPTDATTALDKAFVCMGYAGDDGVTNSDAPDTDTVKAWGGDTVLIINNGKADTFKLKLIEALNPEVLKAVYNSSNVTGTLADGLTVKANNDDGEHRVWVIEMIMRGNVAKRIVIPDAVISDMDDISYTDSDETGYDVTLTAMPDSDGNSHYEYIKSTVTTA